MGLSRSRAVCCVLQSLWRILCCQAFTVRMMVSSTPAPALPLARGLTVQQHCRLCVSWCGDSELVQCMFRATYVQCQVGGGVYIIWNFQHTEGGGGITVGGL